MTRSTPLLVWSTLVVLAVVSPTNACEFCVREVGFVSVFDNPYRVVLAVDAGTSDADRNGLRDRAVAAIGPANVVVEVVESSKDDRRESVVHSPDGRTRSLNVDDLEGLVDSRARRGLAEALADGYATVLLVEGNDPASNTAAAAVARDAIARIYEVKDEFDRVIAVGPSLRIVRADEREPERWLLWSLGVEVDDDRPAVAVLYGRGRRLGDVLQGESLTEEDLFRLLSYVARDCECSLDKKWLYGRPIPLAWTDETRQRVRRGLGFDPEGAATLAEVGRILRRRGPGLVPTDPFVLPAIERTGIPGLRIVDLEEPASSEPTDVGAVPENPRSVTAAAPGVVAPTPDSRTVAAAAGVLVLGCVVLCGRGRAARRR